MKAEEQYFLTIQAIKKFMSAIFFFFYVFITVLSVKKILVSASKEGSAIFHIRSQHNTFNMESRIVREVASEKLQKGWQL